MKTKLFSILTLLLCVCSGAWADTELLSVDFSTWDVGNLANGTVKDGVTINSNGSNVSISTVNEVNYLNFGGNKQYNRCIAIPLTGINEKITVTLTAGPDKNGSTNGNVNYAYAFFKNTSTIKTDGNSTGFDGTTDRLGSGTTITFEVKTEYTTGVLYIGRTGSNYIYLKGVTITTPTAATGDYTITNGNPANGAITVASAADENDEVSITATPDDGYEFTSWNIFKTGDEATTISPAAATATTTFTMPAYNVTVSATFTALPTYTVTYDLNGGTGTTPTESDKAAGSSITLASASGITPPTGKLFKGWLCNVDGVTYAAGASYTMTGAATTFTAQYAKGVQKIIYSLTGNVGSAEVTASDATVNAGTSLVLTNTNGRIKLTAVTGEQFKNGDAIAFSGTIGNTSKNYGVKYGSATGIGDGSLYVAGTTDPLAVSGTLTLSAATNDLYIGRYDGTTTTLTSLIISREMAVSSEAFAGVKVNGTALTADAATNGYSIEGTTITLTTDLAVAATPENITLTNHVVYADESTGDNDVTVSFDGTVTAGYYVGTATIDETEYTVKVLKDVSVSLALSETSGTVTITDSWKAVGTTTVTLTGGNLTDGEYTVTADVTGTTIEPATFTVSDGSVSETFTITTSKNTAGTTVFTFGTDAIGTEAPTYTLTFLRTAKRSVSQTDVTEATEWDWSSNAGSASIELTETTDPANGEEFLLAELPEMPNSADFNSQALKVVCQWPNRGSNSYLQGNVIKFNVTVPGTVKVWFSNTNNREDNATNRRYLYINGTNTEVFSIKQNEYETGELAVNAGEVTINAYTGEDTPASTMIRVQKITFTPCETIKIAASGWTSLASVLPLDFANAEDASSNKNLKAYVISNITSSAVTLTSVESAPAETGLILKGTASTAYTIPVSASPEAISKNELSAAVTATAVETESVYVVSGGELKLFTGNEIPAGKAYLQKSKVDAVGARSLSFIFDDETTGISNVENSQRQLLEGDFYNLAGQRVAAPAKGMYIVNGRKVVIK